MIGGTPHRTQPTSLTVEIHTSNERYDLIYQITKHDGACSPCYVASRGHSCFRATITIPSIFIHAPLLHSTTPF